MTGRPSFPGPLGGDRLVEESTHEGADGLEHLALDPSRIEGVDIDEDAMRDWYQVESARGEVQAARCLAMFSGFLSWCSKQRDYRDLVHSDAAKPRLLSDLLPPSVSRTDALEASQLPAWFAAARVLPVSGWSCWNLRFSQSARESARSSRRE